MKEVQHTSGWRTFSVALTVFFIAAAAGAWAASSVFASKPTTVDLVAPAEASVVISPMELMVARGRQLPVAEYAEPF